MTPRRLLIALLLLVAVMVIPKVGSQADHGWQDGDGTQYRWASSSISLVSSVPDYWGRRVLGAARSWTQGAVDLIPVSGARSSSCPAIRGAIRVCKGSYGQTGWAGYTQLSVDGHGTILWATVKLNSTYLPTNGERRAAACHELGHALGLTHHDQSDSCLTPVLGSRYPNAHDYQQLEAIYAGGSA